MPLILPLDTPSIIEGGVVSRTRSDVVLGDGGGHGPRGRDVVELGLLTLSWKASLLSKQCSMEVIHQENRCAHQTRGSEQVPEYASSRPSSRSENSVLAWDRTRISATARFIPFAPVGGTMCAASPARKKPAVLHRLADEGAHLRCLSGRSRPWPRSQPSWVASLVESSSQILSSGHPPRIVLGSHWSRALDLAGRVLTSASPVMEGVDQLLRRWRSLDEDAEPPKGIGSGVLRARILGDPAPAHPERAVAAGDVVTGDLLLLAILEKAILGESVSKSSTLSALASEQDLPSASSLARIRSLTTSCLRRW